MLEVRLSRDSAGTGAGLGREGGGGRGECGGGAVDQWGEPRPLGRRGGEEREREFEREFEREVTGTSWEERRVKQESEATS